VFAIFASALIVSVIADGVKALIEGSGFDLANDVWHGAILGVVLLIARHRVSREPQVWRRSPNSSRSA
jgi:hypothetical protein